MTITPNATQAQSEFVQNDAEPHCPEAPGCSTLDGPAT